MTAISSWVLSIAGIIILTVIVEIIMPDGNMNKFIKGFLVIFTIFVMVSPITNISFDDVFGGGDYELTLDNEFLEEVENDKLNEYCNIIIDKLSAEGYLNVSIEFQTRLEDGEVNINTIFVNLCDLVLKNNAENINKYNNIKQIIKSVVKVNEEDIIFYE